jgi:hypothetical protein
MVVFNVLILLINPDNFQEKRHMKTLFKSLLITLCCLTGLTAYAQEKKTEFSVSTGFATRLTTDPNSFEASNGFHLGVNLYKRKASKWTWDAQLSMNYTSDKFTASGHITINALYGARYYFTKPESATRFFMSILGGLALRNESGDDFISTYLDVGYSGGFFMETKQLLFGISVDSPQNVIFKVGYKF